MTDLEKLIKEIIPYPADHSHREGFTNEQILGTLSKEERDLVEIALIDLLDKNPWDILIVETLASMKSIKSLPTLRRLLIKCKHGFDKLSIATSIYDICQDKDMIPIVVNEFTRFEKKTRTFRNENIMAAFYYLSRFDDDQTNNLIGKYLDHKNYLISYNAKRFYKK